MTVVLGLAGDTMFGRAVAQRLATDSARSLFSPQLVDVCGEADFFILNLECCISDRGTPWPDQNKPFFFRGPPVAVEALALLGVDCVSLANNHALDFGEEALLDTQHHLREAGIQTLGAGADLDSARSPVVLEHDGFRLGVLGVTDHPYDFRAAPGRAGVAHADLRAGVPGWITGSIHRLAGVTNAVLVTPHWGPNMAADPVPHVRRAADKLVEAEPTVIAGHSAHVFHGVGDRVIYDLGDFLDDYAVDPVLRNDLGLLFLVSLGERGPARLEAIPLRLDFCHTRLADGADHRWIADRFRRACRELGTDVIEEGGRLVIEW